MNAEIVTECLNDIYKDTPKLSPVPHEKLGDFFLKVDPPLYIKNQHKSTFKQMVFVGCCDSYRFFDHYVKNCYIQLSPYNNRFVLPTISPALRSILNKEAMASYGSQDWYTIQQYLSEIPGRMVLQNTQLIVTKTTTPFGE